MAKRKRRPTEPGEFEDPLDNYDSPTYADDLERSLGEDAIPAVMKIEPFKTIPASSTVAEAVATMSELGIACLMIADEQGHLVGVFSERDVLNEAAGEYDADADQPVSQVMTPDPSVVHEADPPARALNLLATGGFRHIPVVDADGRPVGILGPRRVTAYLKAQLDQAG